MVDRLSLCLVWIHCLVGEVGMSSLDVNAGFVPVDSDWWVGLIVLSLSIMKV